MELLSAAFNGLLTSAGRESFVNFDSLGGMANIAERSFPTGPFLPRPVAAGLPELQKQRISAVFRAFEAVAHRLLNVPNSSNTMNTLELIEPEKCAPTGENIIHLPFGLLGFERAKTFGLVARPHEEPFLWLQMLDESRNAFLVVSPFLVMPTYQPEISHQDVDYLELTAPTDVMIINIVTLRRNAQATINLKGPVVINRHTMIGKQVIPNNAAQFSVKHPLPVS
jgi:flagellar assembly factor FliW